MPEQFDPAWEYREDNPELADVFPVDRSLYSVFVDYWRANKFARKVNHGFRFGNGAPDRFVLADPQFVPVVDSNTISDRVCPTCKIPFRPARNSVVHCSRSCRPYPGKQRVLPDVVCRCGRSFRPRWKHNRFCSRKCANEDCSVRFDAKSLVKLEPKLAKFRIDYLSGAPMPELVASYGVSLAQLKRWRRKLGLPPRPPGNYSRVKAKPTLSD